MLSVDEESEKSFPGARLASEDLNDLEDFLILTCFLAPLLFVDRIEAMCRRFLVRSGVREGVGLEEEGPELVDSRRSLLLAVGVIL